MKKIFCALVIICCCLGSLEAKGQRKSELDSLDYYLDHKEKYDCLKKKTISKLHHRLAQARIPIERYKHLSQLFDEYKSYKYDSAYHYARKSIETARMMGDKDCLAEANCNMVFCLMSAGLYKEACDAAEAIDTTGLSKHALMKYEYQCIMLYYAMSDYNHAKPYLTYYHSQANRCYARMEQLMSRDSVIWWYMLAQKQMKDYDYARSIATFKRLLTMNIDLHTRAIAESCLGWMLFNDGIEEEALHHFIRSAICDIKTSTKETTALRLVAEVLYNNNEMKRAMKYVQLSLDDANFYDARQRKLEIGEILPIIEKKNNSMMATQQRWLTAGIILALLLVTVSVGAAVIFQKQKRKLMQARKVITQRNLQLEMTNKQLNEANTIKDEYIGNSFYNNAQFIDKLERLYKNIEREIVTRQYQTVLRTLNETTLNKERLTMFSAFDSTFLKLFPHFVEEFNLLFDPEDRKEPGEGRLNTDMRIFALIRLGITQSERIAMFLNYSVNTINTYKTRIKNKSIVSNEEFERRIMDIK